VFSERNTERLQEHRVTEALPSLDELDTLEVSYSALRSHQVRENDKIDDLRKILKNRGLKADAQES